MQHPIPLTLAENQPEHPLLTQLRVALDAYSVDSTVGTAVTLRGAVLLLAEAMQESDPAPFGSKAAAMNNPVSCWRKAELTEPVFILRAKDPIASAVVSLWATLATTTGAHEESKAIDAHNVAHAMDSWRASQPEARILTILSGRS